VGWAGCGAHEGEIEEEAGLAAQTVGLGLAQEAALGAGEADLGEVVVEFR
jgi:hypothetical protein